MAYKNFGISIVFFKWIWINVFIVSLKKKLLEMTKYSFGYASTIKFYSHMEIVILI